jgi:hypothetical protein
MFDSKSYTVLLVVLLFGSVLEDFPSDHVVAREVLPRRSLQRCGAPVPGELAADAVAVAGGQGGAFVGFYKELFMLRGSMVGHGIDPLCF